MAANDNIQDAVVRVRRAHEPYAKKGNRLNSPASRGGGRSASTRRKYSAEYFKEYDKLMAEGYDIVKANQIALSHELARYQKENEKKFKQSKEKNVAIGSADYIDGKDLFSIKPSALNFNQAIQETSMPLNHEVLYLFNKDGNVIGRYGGAKGSVDIPDGAYSRSAATLHNHPRYYGSFLPFSIGDLQTYCRKNKNMEHYVVTERYVYKFKVGNMDVNGNFLNEAVKLIDIADKNVKNYVTEHGMTKKAYYDGCTERANSHHEIYKKLASKYGYEYDRISIEDFKKTYKI